MPALQQLFETWNATPPREKDRLLAALRVVDQLGQDGIELARHLRDHCSDDDYQLRLAVLDIAASQSPWAGRSGILPVLRPSSSDDHGVLREQVRDRHRTLPSARSDPHSRCGVGAHALATGQEIRARGCRRSARPVRAPADAELLARACATAIVQPRAMTSC